MRSISLRRRLFIGAAISIAAALGLAGLGLVLLFERYVERRVENELKSHLRQLAAGIEVANDGRITVKRALADPRFAEPFSGLYWQIDLNGNDVARSRSLWDERLLVPSHSEDVHTHQLTGPAGVELFAQERLASIEINGKSQPLVLTVGVDRREIGEAVSSFTRDLVASLILLGTALVVAAWIQVSIGLRPLELLRERLERVRSGRVPRLEGEFPREVQPLADEVNGLLETQEQALERARNRAGDLAHGLKTPITILDSIARDLRRNGSANAAGELEEQAAIIGHHVDRELARARLSYGRPTHVGPLRASVDRMIAAMTRLPRGCELVWTNDVPEDTRMMLEEQDLIELLGNLLDNARKWGRSRARIAVEGNALIVEDDGPGVPEAERQRIVERGRRLDEATQGSGLGLAIVEDIVKLHELSLDVSRSRLGGLRVAIGLERS
jgi:signal transduction histidine kinase